MANVLKMAMIERKTVARYIKQVADFANSPTGSECSKGAILPTGSEHVPPAPRAQQLHHPADLLPALVQHDLLVENLRIGQHQILATLADDDAGI